MSDSLFCRLWPVCLVLFFPYPPPLAAEPAGPFTLDAAVAEALAGNPGLAEMSARAEAMAAIAPQEGSLPDPVLRFDAQNLPSNGFNLRREDMTYLQAGFSQELPFPGKLALKEKAAEHEAAGARDSVEEARLRLVRDVKLLWWQLFYRERALELIAATEEKFTRLADATLNRYRVGAGMQQDVLLAQLELSKLRDMALDHARQHHGEIARLNALLDRPAGGLLRLPPPDEPVLPPAPEPAALLELAERHRPLLAQQRQLIDAAQSRVELADKGYYPDFNVGADYAARQNTPAGLARSDFANFHVSVNLPIYAGSKQAKAVDQRHGELLREHYAFHDSLRQVQAEVAEDLAAYAGSRAQFQLAATTLLPQARQTALSLLSAYQVGQADFANVLRAEAAVLEYQTRRWQSYVQAQQAWARLAMAVGKEGL